MAKPKYHSYLLRLWRENDKKKPIWRFVLINLSRREEQGFASLERLVTFLKNQMDEVSTSEPMPPDEIDTQDNCSK